MCTQPELVFIKELAVVSTTLCLSVPVLYSIAGYIVRKLVIDVDCAGRESLSIRPAADELAAANRISSPPSSSFKSSKFATANFGHKLELGRLEGYTPTQKDICLQYV